MLEDSRHQLPARGLGPPLVLPQSQPEVDQDPGGRVLVEVIKEEDHPEEFGEVGLRGEDVGEVVPQGGVGEGGGGEGLPRRLSGVVDGLVRLHSHRARGGNAPDGKARGSVRGGSRGPDGDMAWGDGMGLGGRLHACIQHGGMVEGEVVNGGRDHCGRGLGMELFRVGGVAHSVLAPCGGKGHNGGSGEGGGQLQDGGEEDGEEEEEGLQVQGHLLGVQSHGIQAHEPPRRTPDQHGGVGLEGGGGGGGGVHLHMEPHGHLWPRRALLPEIKEEFTETSERVH